MLIDMSKLTPYLGINNRKIIATKRLGNDVALLAQYGDSFILSFAEIVVDSNGSHLKVLAQRLLSIDEVKSVLETIFSNNTSADPILLESADLNECVFSCTECGRNIQSPYFDTTDAFLSFQKTRGPNL